MSSLTGPDRRYGVLQIERRNGVLNYRGHIRDLLASGLVTKDMLPAAAEHARCSFGAAPGERCVIARLPAPDTYELRVDTRPTSLHSQPAPTSGGKTAPPSAIGAPSTDDVIRIVREYSRFGVGVLELIDKLLGQATGHEGIEALQQTIVHLKQIYAGLERRHCSALGTSILG